MSIFARSTREPSGNSPARIRRKRSRFSSTDTVPVRAFAARFLERAAVLADLVGGEIVDVGLAVANQRFGAVVQLLEIVGRVVEPIVPREAQPADVILNRVDVLDVFGDRVGVVEAEIAAAGEVLARLPKLRQIDLA